MFPRLMDRFDALGIPHPDPELMCKGECKGVGVYPVKLDTPDLTDEERRRWQAAHAAGHCNATLREEYCDGWHFITCPDCGGTGKAAASAHSNSSA